MILLKNHVLTNSTFALIIILGIFSYINLPRQEDPSINFNWIVIYTILPGASAIDIEKKITDPLEDAIRNVKDIDFVSSNSRQDFSNILVRFEDIDTRTFDKRVNDLRREIQNKTNELPEEAEDPLIREITSANAYPSATIAVTSPNLNENLRHQTYLIEKELRGIPGVDSIDMVGFQEPELIIAFDKDKLAPLGLAPSDIADTIAVFFQDIAAGSTQINNEKWLLRIVGSSADPSYLEQLPILSAQGEILLGSIAEIKRDFGIINDLASYQGQPAISLAINKKDNANLLALVDKIKAYVNEKNQYQQATGVKLALVDDQTYRTRHAIRVMEQNALLGLSLVLFVTWLFLGIKISSLVTIGIPFSLAGTFLILNIMGETLNLSVLLGIVIALGMIVDDAVVVVESIYFYLQKGMDSLKASIIGIKEVAAPVLASVFTTMSAFLPLMLLPGILGDFMRVIPLVVTLALAISLLEAFWILPNHITNIYRGKRRFSAIEQLRHSIIHKIQIAYARLLIFALRRSVFVIIILISLFFSAIAIIAAGKIPFNFFANDPFRLFYVTIQMPSNTPIEETLAQTQAIELKIKNYLEEKEILGIISYAGYIFTETEPLRGDYYGQIQVNLKPKEKDMRSIDEILDTIREDVTNTIGPIKISFTNLKGGPPVSKPINIKVTGSDYDEIRQAADQLQALLKEIEGVIDIDDDANRGQLEYILHLDGGAVYRTGLNPEYIQRNLSLLADGLIVASMQDKGEKLEVRVKAQQENYANIDDILYLQLPLPQGGSISLKELVDAKANIGIGNLRHYNFKRAITVTADLQKNTIDTVEANTLLQEKWQAYQGEYPNIILDTTGELDDIQESIDAIGMLFLIGLGIIYLILGTQFMSYWQPFLILSTIPLAFIGVVLGLFISQNPISLYTLYGVVALSGIAVNAAIVLISAANTRKKQGMSTQHAIIYAGRRRVIPILITAFTTIAGLFSLAFGLGGKSIIWGSVANAIVFGLFFSTLLTLIAIPVLYYRFMNEKRKRL